MKKKNTSASVLKLATYRKTLKREELRKGSRLNVEYQKIAGVLHTENDSKEGWEENIILISLKDISNYGFQVKTKEVETPDYIGSVILNIKVTNEEERLLDIDARHEWARLVDDELLIGFRYRNPQEDNVQVLLNAVSSYPN